MTTDDGSRPLVDDPNVSADVRNLLAVGIADEVNYDVSSGLSAHLAAIGGVPGSPSGPSVERLATPGARAAASLSTKALLVIGVPAAAASIAAALWLSGALRTHEAEAPKVNSVSPTPPIAAVPGSTSVVVAEPPSAKAPPSLPAPAIGGDEPRSHAELRSGTPARHSRRSTDPGDVADPTAATPAPAAGEHVVSREAQTSDKTPGAAALGGESPKADDAEAVEAARPSADDAKKAAADRLNLEMDGLAEAKRALASDPKRALFLAQEGNRAFPNGLFREERDHILLLALIQLGRTDEARRLAAPYLKDHPNSPFARRVQRALDAATQPAVR